MDNNTLFLLIIFTQIGTILIIMKMGKRLLAVDKVAFHDHIVVSAIGDYLDAVSSVNGPIPSFSEFAKTYIFKPYPIK